MQLVSTRIITDDVKRLVEFYARVTGLTPTWYTDDFAELKTPAATLALASTRTIDMFGAGAARPADIHTAFIEFRVDDVDAAHARLAGAGDDTALPPTTQPWGNRSWLFRDPDGNLVNFFTPVSRAATGEGEAA